MNSIDYAIKAKRKGHEWFLKTWMRDSPSCWHNMSPAAITACRVGRLAPDTSDMDNIRTLVHAGVRHLGHDAFWDEVIYRLQQETI